MTTKDKLVAEAEQLERIAREIEGDGDNPLRVASANKYYARAAVLRSQGEKQSG